MGASGYVHIDVEEIKHETEDAFLLIVDGEKVWVPKSHVADAKDYKKGDKNITLSISEWIANKKGLGG